MVWFDCQGQNNECLSKPIAKTVDTVWFGCQGQNDQGPPFVAHKIVDTAWVGCQGQRQEHYSAGLDPAGLATS